MRSEDLDNGKKEVQIAEGGEGPKRRDRSGPRGTTFKCDGPEIRGIKVLARNGATKIRVLEGPKIDNSISKNRLKHKIIKMSYTDQSEPRERSEGMTPVRGVLEMVRVVKLDILDMHGGREPFIVCTPKSSLQMHQNCISLQRLQRQRTIRTLS